MLSVRSIVKFHVAYHSDLSLIVEGCSSKSNSFADQKVCLITFSLSREILGWNQAPRFFRSRKASLSWPTLVVQFLLSLRVREFGELLLAPGELALAAAVGAGEVDVIIFPLETLRDGRIFHESGTPFLFSTEYWGALFRTHMRYHLYQGTRFLDYHFWNICQVILWQNKFSSGLLLK